MACCPPPVSSGSWLVVAVVVWCGDGDDALAFSAPGSFCEVNQQRGSFLCFVTMRVLPWYLISVELVRANKSKFGVLFTHIDGCSVCVCRCYVFVRTWGHKVNVLMKKPSEYLIILGICVRMVALLVEIS